jgi:hypothetical protein
VAIPHLLQTPRPAMPVDGNITGMLTAHAKGHKRF